MVPEEERAHGTISNKTYFTYVREGGNTILVLFLIAVFFASQVFIHIVSIFISCSLMHRVALLQLIGGCQDGKGKCELFFWIEFFFFCSGLVRADLVPHSLRMSHLMTLVTLT